MPIFDNDNDKFLGIDSNCGNKICMRLLPTLF